MAIQKITVDQFIAIKDTMPVLDVRSPGEYTHAHIPGAYSLPLFTDEERKVVGTAYKQQHKQTAIKIGLDYFGVKMKKMVEETERLMAAFFSTSTSSNISGSVVVHCWRGGMRSAGVAWLLELYGYKVYTITGGYKAYRKWVRNKFAEEHHLKVLGGYTGSAKTIVLQQLLNAGMPVIDLENMANHKGSAFGALGQAPQPSQEMFENLLAEALHKVKDDKNTPAFIEDESQRIGKLIIPNEFWNQLRNSEIIFLDIPFEKRLDYLAAEYGKFEKEKLVNAVMRIQKRLGGMETKNAINCLLEDNHKECFRILLKYYDKLYHKGLHNRPHLHTLLRKIIFDRVDAPAISNNLMHEKSFQ